VSLVPILRQDAGLYLAGFSLVVGNLLMPVWLLQGLERMREVAIIQVFGRIAALLPLFLLVKTPQDVAWAVFYAGAASIVGGIVSLVWISQSRVIQWERPKWASMLNVLREGGVLFLSKLYMSAYTLLAPLALGAISGTTSVGYFALADRILRVAQALLEPITQALFPRLSHLYGKDRRAARYLVKQTAAIIVALSGLTGVFLWVAADWIIELLGGGEFAPAVAVLRWLAVVPLVMGLSNVLGVQIMLPNGLSRAFSQIAGFAAMLGIVVISPLVYWKDAEGAAMAILLVELFIAVAMGVYLYGRRTRDGQARQSAKDV
jgi:PST family polysaccharide transporter